MRSGTFRALLRTQMTSALLLTLPRIWRVATISVMSSVLWKWWVVQLSPVAVRKNLNKLVLRSSFCFGSIQIGAYSFTVQTFYSIEAIVETLKLSCILELFVNSSLNNVETASFRGMLCIPQLKLHAASCGHYFLDWLIKRLDWSSTPAMHGISMYRHRLCCNLCPSFCKGRRQPFIFGRRTAAERQ